MRSKAVTRKHWQFDFYNQWSDIFGKNNWYDITLINISGEYAHYSDSVEIRLGLLGFNFTITHRRSFDFIDELDDRVKIIKALEAEHPGKEIKDPFGVLDELDKDV